METVQQETEKTDFAAALRQYHAYGRGRSMKKFCEDEGYDYRAFCRNARKGDKEAEIAKGGFVELHPEPSPQMTIREIRIEFSTGLVLSQSTGDIECLMSMVRRILQ